MDALSLFGLRYDVIHGDYVDDLLEGLSDAQVRATPHGLNSIAWLLWHAARVEDVAVNRFVADRPQVLQAGNWNARLGIERLDAGPGMTSAEVGTLSQTIELSAVRGYWNAVAQATGEVAATLTPAALDEVVDPSRIRSIVRDEGVLTPAAEWVGEFWANNRSRGWLLLQTGLLHPYGHLYDCATVKGLVTAKAA